MDAFAVQHRLALSVVFVLNLCVAVSCIFFATGAKINARYCIVQATPAELDRKKKDHKSSLPLLKHQRFDNEVLEKAGKCWKVRAKAGHTIQLFLQKAQECFTIATKE